MATNLIGLSNDPNNAGVLGEGGTGVYGRDITHTGNGVIGYSDDGRGVWGHSKTGFGVLGQSVNGIGVSGESTSYEGVRGTSHNANHGGVVGVNTGGGIAVYGTSENGVGVWGTSVNSEGIHAETKSLTTAAIAAYQMNESSDSAALYAKHYGNKNAAVFEGNLVVTGNIDVTGPGSDIRLTNADCAEDFDVYGANNVEPGTVMVLGDEGALFESQQAYDKRAAGVISGAGDYKPGIVLDVRKTSGNRQPIALMGKVFCKVDAQFGTIQVGDLLTTSPTPGHAMVASDPARAFGAIIGKALRPLSSGEGLIPILVALQ